MGARGSLTHSARCPSGAKQGRYTPEEGAARGRGQEGLKEPYAGVP